MSEFSDSFHLRTDDPEDAIELLRRAKVPGFVFPPAFGFVSFVCPRDKRFYQQVLGANLGLLVDYSFAADHGCWVNLYERDVKVGNLSAAFEEERSRFDREAFIDIGLVDPQGAEAIAEWVREAHDPSKRSRETDHLVAKKLRLPQFSWLSYHYALSDETPPDGRIEVDREGHAHTLEDASQAEIDQILEQLPPQRRSPGAPKSKRPPPVNAPKAKTKTKTPAKTKAKAPAKTKTPAKAKAPAKTKSKSKAKSKAPARTKSKR